MGSGRHTPVGHPTLDGPEFLACNACSADDAWDDGGRADGVVLWRDCTRPPSRCEHDGHTIDVGYVHVLTEAGACREDCPHPDHRIIR